MGGRMILPSSPNLQNISLISEAVVFAGKFFARITVFDRAFGACKKQQYPMCKSWLVYLLWVNVVKVKFNMRKAPYSKGTAMQLPQFAFFSLIAVDLLTSVQIPKTQYINMILSQNQSESQIFIHSIITQSTIQNSVSSL